MEQLLVSVEWRDRILGEVVEWLVQRKQLGILGGDSKFPEIISGLVKTFPPILDAIQQQTKIKIPGIITESFGSKSTEEFPKAI